MQRYIAALQILETLFWKYVPSDELIMLKWKVETQRRELGLKIGEIKDYANIKCAIQPDEHHMFYMCWKRKAQQSEIIIKKKVQKLRSQVKQ